jgi:hypothetical protein
MIRNLFAAAGIGVGHPMSRREQKRRYRKRYPEKLAEEKARYYRRYRDEILAKVREKRRVEAARRKEKSCLTAPLPDRSKEKS